MLREALGGRDLEPIIAEHPLKRVGQPIDIAYGILYLASDESSWITGTVLPIDGGFLLRKIDALNVLTKTHPI